MTNRINKLFQTKQSNILSVYFTAGYPNLSSTTRIIKDLADSGADMIEIGIPFSDPLADGPVIQKSSNVALRNGMNLKLLFRQLKNIRSEVSIPLLMMGYINPVLQFGIENFCQNCAETGIDGVILPDLPPEIYMENHQKCFEKYHIHNIFLISPQTSDDRIRLIDQASHGFIYMVSSSSTTGKEGSFTDDQVNYFKRVSEMKLNNPLLIGFGISGHETFTIAGSMSYGAIIGSAFIKMLSENGESRDNIQDFIKSIRNKHTGDFVV